MPELTTLPGTVIRKDGPITWDQEHPGWWEEIFPPEMKASEAANRILADLYGYAHNSKSRQEDVRRLAAALTGWSLSRK